MTVRDHELHQRRARLRRRRADHRADRPEHRRGVRRRRRCRGEADVDAAFHVRRARVRGLARHHAARAPARAAADRRRDRGARRGARRRRVARTPASRRELTMSEEIPPMSTRSASSPARRGCWRASRPASTWAASRRSSGASRSACARPVAPWNYPVMMARLEVGARARRRQHDGAQAVRHHAGEHASGWPR